jgi:hypothetical protein
METLTAWVLEFFIPLLIGVGISGLGFTAMVAIVTFVVNTSRRGY